MSLGSLIMKYYVKLLFSSVPFDQASWILQEVINFFKENNIDKLMFIRNWQYKKDDNALAKFVDLGNIAGAVNLSRELAVHACIIVNCDQSRLADLVQSTFGFYAELSANSLDLTA
jgi:hypothetical protein